MCIYMYNTKFQYINNVTIDRWTYTTKYVRVHHCYHHYSNRKHRQKSLSLSWLSPNPRTSAWWPATFYSNTSMNYNAGASKSGLCPGVYGIEPWENWVELQFSWVQLGWATPTSIPPSQWRWCDGVIVMVATGFDGVLTDKAQISNWASLVLWGEFESSDRRWKDCSHAATPVSHWIAIDASFIAAWCVVHDLMVTNYRSWR